MVTISLGYAEGDSKQEDLARIRLHNMYLTENRYSPDGLARLTRPTLDRFKELSNTPIYGFWRQEGTINNNWFVVCGETLFLIDPITFVETNIGQIPGTDYCVFAGTTDRVLIVRNGVAWSTDGLTVAQINMPDDRPVGSVSTIDGSFLLGQLGAQRFYWIKPGETDPDPLSFASAERTPDSVTSINIISDEIWFLGASGVEVWQTTGDADLPYQRIAGRVYSEGCIDPATAYQANFNGFPCLLWVTEKRAVMMAQGSPARISSKSVEEALRFATNFRSWGFRFNQHDFYVISTDQCTLVYDLTQQIWSKWDSYLHDYWRAHLGVQVDEHVYAGDANLGILWQLTDGFSDDGVMVVRECSGFVLSMNSGEVCSSVNVRMNAGWAPEYTQNPNIEMRWSDDYGFSWTEYFPANIGRKGNYEYDVTWRSLGSYERPGREFEFRFSDFAKFRIDYATMNEV